VISPQALSDLPLEIRVPGTHCVGTIADVDISEKRNHVSLTVQPLDLSFY